MGFLDKLFGKKKPDGPKEFTQEESDKDYELKSAGLERVLGKMHTMVGHAIIPFSIGGAVDMYYFCEGIKGTGFATMELLNPDGIGPVPGKIGTYELVTFTKEPYNDNTENPTAFNKIERRMCGLMTTIGAYSFQAKLQPMETVEVPAGKDEPNRCVILDEYKPNGTAFTIGDRTHGLLLVIEVFREEMEFARAMGSATILNKLKENGHYPYSDLNRDSVLKSMK